MFFVGSGALLSQAVAHSRTVGIEIDLVCCPVGDGALPRLRKLDVPVLASEDPNAELLPHLIGKQCSKVFSINNRYILNDGLLTAGPAFFNIHNGLIQDYRGIAEICVFAALCRGERQYGVTLHRLLPSHKVDTGPVVAQRSFAIEPADAFHQVMRRALDHCSALFNDNAANIDRGNDDPSLVPTSRHAFSYKDVMTLCAEADTDRLSRASDLGAYKAFFPELTRAVSAFRSGQGRSDGSPRCREDQA